MIGIADPNQCAAMCRNTFPGAPFLFAGSEFGQECWCGATLASTAQRLPDIACASMGCFGSNQEACGGEFIMAVYQMLERIQVGCAPLNLSLITLNIQAIFLDDPEISVPITMVGIEHHLDNIPPIEIATEAGILSACPTCPNPVAFHFIDLRLLPTLDAGTAINNLSVVHPGGTPNFVEITDSLSMFGGYCIREPQVDFHNLIALGANFEPELPITVPPNITFNADAPWALCSNLTAGGRLDVVFKPLLFGVGLNVTDCRDVVLSLQFLD